MDFSYLVQTITEKGSKDNTQIKQNLRSSQKKIKSKLCYFKKDRLWDVKKVSYSVIWNRSKYFFLRCGDLMTSVFSYKQFLTNCDDSHKNK